MDVILYVLIGAGLLVLLAGCGGGGGKESEPSGYSQAELRTVQEPANEMPRHFSFEPSLGIRNNPPMLFTDYALVSRYVGGTMDYFFQDGEFWSVIDTRMFPFERVPGGGPQRILQRKVDMPLLGNVYSFDLAVPMFEGDGVAQVTFVLYAQDGRGLTVAIVLSAWDNRFDDHPENADFDLSTPFVSSPLRSGRYVTMLPGSDKMFTGTSEQVRRFRFKLTEQNVKNIIADINVFQKQRDGLIFGTDPADYNLTLTGILQEVFLMDNPYKKVVNRVRFRGVRIERNASE